MDYEKQMDGESSIAFHSYQTYRDMGVTRSIIAAYTIYLKEIDKFGSDASRKVTAVSKHFKQWSINFCWDDRVKEWDAGHAKRLQAKLLEADQEKYVNSVENLRSEVESVAKGLMQISKLSSVISAARLAGMATELGLGKKSNIISQPISRELLHEHDKLTATAGNAAKILVTASEKLSEALGLERIITELNNAKDAE
jgi:hypothetical protein